MRKYALMPSRRKQLKLTSKYSDNEEVITLYQICSLVDIPGVVRKGEKGGFVEDDNILSHKNYCWIDSKSIVVGNCQIAGDAQIRNSFIAPGSVIQDKAIIENTFANETIEMIDNSIIRQSTISGLVKMSGNSQIVNSTINEDRELFNDDVLYGYVPSVLNYESDFDKSNSTELDDDFGDDIELGIPGIIKSPIFVPPKTSFNSNGIPKAFARIREALKVNNNQQENYV